jgi:hypothetical protein
MIRLHADQRSRCFALVIYNKVAERKTVGECAQGATLSISQPPIGATRAIR